jgi:SAM-dependent methyltransferase
MELGWEVTGIDPDPKVAGQAAGLRVQQGGLPDTGLTSESFDEVTLSHVIEHTHDPVASLREVFRLLRPGGQVWIATPNVRSDGHRWFRANWIGLHPPAHLVLFNHTALWRALQLAGFEVPRLCAMRSQVGQDHLSWRLSKGELPFSSAAVGLPTSLKFRRAMSDLCSVWTPSRREEIVVIARRPLSAIAGNRAPPQ